MRPGQAGAGAVDTENQGTRRRHGTTDSVADLRPSPRESSIGLNVSRAIGCKPRVPLMRSNGRRARGRSPAAIERRHPHRSSGQRLFHVSTRPRRSATGVRRFDAARRWRGSSSDPPAPSWLHTRSSAHVSTVLTATSQTQAPAISSFSTTLSRLQPAHG